jgi:hypothetical protein
MQVLPSPGLNNGSSMNGTNMVSADPDGKLPSTSSEATDGVKLGDPNLDVPDDTWNPQNRVHGDDSGAGDATWLTVQGVGH